MMKKTKYKQIYEDTKDKILKGVYPSGTQIPEELAVCEEYNCSRMTVKKAYDLLAGEGLIYRKQGQGSFVLANPAKHMIEVHERELSGFTRAGGFQLKDGQIINQDKGGAITSKVLNFSLIFATPEIADKLNVKPGEPLYDILRVRLVDEKPYVIEQTYMPTALIPGITEDVLHQSVYAYIENVLNLKISAAQKVTRADCSDELDQKEMGLKKEEPVLEVEQVAFLDNGTPFEYSISRHRYDLFKFSSFSVRN